MMTYFGTMVGNILMHIVLSKIKIDTNLETRRKYYYF